MTLSASIDLCRSLTAEYARHNRADFDRWPVGATFNVIRRRTRLIEATFTKIGAATVSDVGTVRLVCDTPVITGAVVLELVSVPEDAERFESIA